MRYLITTTDKDGHHAVQNTLAEMGQLPQGYTVKSIPKKGMRGVFDLYLVPPQVRQHSVSKKRRSLQKHNQRKTWFDNADLMTVLVIVALLVGIALKSYVLN